MGIIAGCRRIISVYTQIIIWYLGISISDVTCGSGTKIVKKEYNVTSLSMDNSYKILIIIQNLNCLYF